MSRVIFGRFRKISKILSVDLIKASSELCLDYPDRWFNSIMEPAETISSWSDFSSSMSKIIEDVESQWLHPIQAANLVSIS